MQAIIEISAYSIEWAVAAAKAGASRIELCDNISEGGTSPGYGMIKQCLQKVKIPVMVLIRPRGGNFYYSDSEFESMKDDISMVKEAGAKGVVFGIMDKNGNVDMLRNQELLDIARPMEVCFHRAFDLTIDPEKSLNELIEIGFDRVLTSGQKSKAEEGLELITRLIEISKGKIIIMPGAGINSFNIGIIAKKTGAREFHLSAKKVDWEEPLNTRSDICFSAPGTRLFKIDVQKVKDIKEKLRSL